MVNKIIHAWYQDFPGCSHQQHADALEVHNQTIEGVHNSLPDVIPEEHRLRINALDRLDFLTRGDLEEDESLTDGPTLRSRYCGKWPDLEEANPRHVCLHASAINEETHENPVALDHPSDIDSFCGFSDTIAIAKQGIDHQTVSNERQNIKDAIHGHIKADHIDSHEPVELRDIPHQFFGRVKGDAKIGIWIIYPRLPRGDSAHFNGMTMEQLTEWNDQIWIPVVTAVLPGHAVQDFPASYRDANNKARAQQTETRLRTGSAYNTVQQITSFLPPQYLPELNRGLRAKTNLPRFKDYKGFIIYFGAKGVKNEFRTDEENPRLEDAITKFRSHLKRTLHLSLIPFKRFWVDIAHEICSHESWVLSELPNDEDPQPLTFLPRRCCMEKFHDWLYQEDAERRASPTTLYHIAMLGDAASLTSTPPIGSKLNQGGLVYVQVYARVKTVFEATKHFVNEQDGLEELALDPNLIAGLHEGAGGQARQIKVMEHAYCRSKHRLMAAIEDCRYKSYAVRQEMRITMECLMSLWARLDDVDDDLAAPEHVHYPTWAFGVTTSDFFKYIQQHAGKFATGFEVVRAQSAPTAKTWEETKVMTMMLRCLRYAVGGHQLSREASLWQTHKQYDDGRSYHGLGFRQSLTDYKYCWIRDDLLDWDQLAFRPELTEHVVFNNKTLLGGVLRRGKRLRYFFNDSKRIDVGINMLEHHGDHPAIVSRALEFLAHLILRQLRTDIWAKIKKEVVQGVGIDRSAEADGNWFLCRDKLHELYGNHPQIPHLLHGNRSSQFRVLDVVRQKLFIGFDDARVMARGKGWNDPWVAYLKRVQEMIRLLPNPAVMGMMKETLNEVFFQHHWIMPHSHKDGLLGTSKFRGNNRRTWVSIVLDQQRVAERAARGEGLSLECYKWGQKGWRPGQPPGYPPFLEFDKDQWDDWIAQTLQPAPAPPPAHQNNDNNDNDDDDDDNHDDNNNNDNGNDNEDDDENDNNDNDDDDDDDDDNDNNNAEARMMAHQDRLLQIQAQQQALQSAQARRQARLLAQGTQSRPSTATSTGQMCYVVRRGPGNSRVWSREESTTGSDRATPTLSTRSHEEDIDNVRNIFGGGRGR